MCALCAQHLHESIILYTCTFIYMYHIGRSYTEAKCWQVCGDTGTLACCLGRAVCYLVKVSINMYLRLISSTPGSIALVNDQVLKETYTRRVVVALFVATRYWWQGKFVSGKEVGAGSMLSGTLQQTVANQ